MPLLGTTDRTTNFIANGPQSENRRPARLLTEALFAAYWDDLRPGVRPALPKPAVAIRMSIAIQFVTKGWASNRKETLMNRNFALVVAMFIGFALLWRSFVPYTTAAEAGTDAATTEESKDAKVKDRDKAFGGTKVATLDLGAAFKVHRDFLQRTAQMKKDVQEAEERLRVRSNGLTRMNDKLGTLAKNSDEYRSLSIEIVKAANELKTDTELEKKKFVELEARLYGSIYEDIMAHVKKYAASHQIELILRVNKSEGDRSDPQDVLKELNKTVLYSEGLDITADIIALVNAN
jgi:hypothetical protein